MSVRLFEEGTNLIFPVAYRQAGADYVPTTVEWTLRNVTHDKTVVDWTSETPATAIDINVSAAYTVLEDQGCDEELFEFTVVADRGLSTQIPKTLRFRIANVKAL